MKSIFHFQKMKSEQKKISMLTCYDSSFAKLIDQSNVDMILVGDSLAQVMHGHNTTLQATVPMMALHTAAVARAAKEKFIVADMPFLSTRKGLRCAVESAGRLMRAGAHAVKIENAKGHLDLISHLVESGIPVMGHLGLTPQSVFQIGGHKIQGRSDQQATQILQDALALEKAGCFSLVLECIPEKLALKITKALSIPTIGIGAGQHVDGQVLVLQDLLGMNADFNPKFLKKYFNAAKQFAEIFNQYDAEVKNNTFPTQEHSYE